MNEIVSSTQAEFKAAAKTVFKQPSFDAKAWFDNLSKNALPGGDAIAAIWKSSFGAVGEKASTAVTVVTKPTKKVAESAAGVLGDQRAGARQDRPHRLRLRS